MTDQIVFPGTLINALSSNLILPGSRLLLRGGNYIFGDLQCNLSGVTIMPYENEPVTIMPTNGYRCFLFQDVSDIVLSGLVIDGSNVTECIKLTNASSNIRITGCEIRNAPSQGILITGACHDLEIDNCNVHHNGLDHFDHGIYLSSDYVGFVANIHHNVISNNASNGIHAFNEAGGVDSVYAIFSNYLAQNGEVGIGLYHGLATVFNNVVRNIPGRAITCRYQLISGLIAFNTIAGSNMDIELNVLTNNPELNIFNNLFMDGGGGIVNFPNVPLSQGNNLEPDWTLIADNGGADIRPLAGSLAIGGGIVIDGITTDYGGNPRGVPPTIGAWE